jgi:hypothetical protein
MEWVYSEDVSQIKAFTSAKKLYLPPAMKAERQVRDTAVLFL